MKIKHPAVITRLLGGFQTKFASKNGENRVGLTFIEFAQRFHLIAKTAGELGESFSRLPDPDALGIDISENTQNAVAISGPRGERVNVQQIVARAQTQCSPLFFNRAETGVVKPPILTIG